MKINLRSITKAISGLAAGYGASLVIEDAIDRNTKKEITVPITASQVSKVIFATIGTFVLSAMIGDAAQKYVSNGVDKAFDKFNDLFKTTKF